MIFLSAGHHLKDPGAVANGLQENKIAIEFRDMVAAELKVLGARFILDKDTETLAEYLKRIQTGSGSVVYEAHADAAGPDATGTTAIIPDDHNENELAMGKELSVAMAESLGIRNRGTITEKQSARGKLGIMRENGIVCLQELFFITNTKDIEGYNKGKKVAAKRVALILKKYDDKIV